MADNDVNNILLEEYKALWKYYTNQINILSGFREHYIKIFIVPAGVLTAAALAVSKTLGEQSAIHTDIILVTIALLLGIAFLIGLAMFVSYYQELGNLGNYEQAMIDIRQHLRETNKLTDVLTVDKYRTKAPIAKLAKKDKKRGFYSSLLFSLGAIFIVGNCFLLALAVVLFLVAMKWHSETWLTICVAFAVGIVTFLILRWWSYELYFFYTGAGAAELSIELTEDDK